MLCLLISQEKRCEKMNGSNFSKVDVDDFQLWMRIMMQSEKARTPCHWISYDGVQSGRKWLFRGQSDADWYLSSSLERAVDYQSRLWEKGEIEKIEKGCIDEFQRLANCILPGRNLIPFDWVALLQHSGGPTRLIDFSYSACVALYFATSEISYKDDDKKKGESDFAVWAISLDNPSNANGRSGVRGVGAECPCACEFGIYKNTAEELFGDKGFGTERSRIYLGFPKFGNARSNAQSGVFLFQSDFEKSFMEYLTECLGPQEPIKLSEVCPENIFENECSTSLSKVIKFTFPHKFRQEATLALRSMNILPHTLFPDLDGIAQTVARSVSELSAHS